MSRIVAAIFVIVSILLAFPFNPHGRAAASPRFQLQQDVYTLSAEALASAKRFSSSPKQRAFADLEVVLNELLRVSGTASAPTFAYQPISRQQLIDLLGSPVNEGENGAIMYAHSFGTTAFYFDGDKLKNFLTLGESTYWYEAVRRPSAMKRVWYKTVRCLRKFKTLLLN